MTILESLNDQINGNLTPINHESLNDTFVGYSNKYHASVFVKVFNSRAKFKTEKQVTKQLSNRILENLELNGKYILVMTDICPVDLDLPVTKEMAYKMGCVLASFHNKVKSFDGIYDEKAYFQKAEQDVAILKNKEIKARLLAILEQFQEKKSVIEHNLANDKVVLHGDVGVRNYKLVNNTLVLIDYERARKGARYQDFIKLFYQDFEQNQELIASFLTGYNSKISNQFSLGFWSKDFLIFLTAIGIMKYTDKIEDHAFKRIGLQMLADIESDLIEK
ncbi:phosphotransferase [Lactobacillus psittaci]|uniref:Aminoglycoside phosphotransferase domain-containing protein n=1 Tax=Lactobacillus psittaci DSM 15354 TaxID=1122152 RepID=A0A0R1SA16_9LACO|nr:phosphotransferase [Lactobacillus psittaci]KRL63027.1 hypothetical protein FC23_GL001211 [Lactobacillus psittaci DSM 15354]